MRKKKLLLMIVLGVWLVFMWRNLRRGPGRYDVTKPVSRSEWLAERLRIEREMRKKSNGHYIYDE